jgi:O-antigen/teichoic acid export membrane protein
MTVALYAGVIYHALPRAPRPARFSGSALANIRRYAAGMMAITLLTLLLTQVDKILLSRLLTLESFGYYALAGVVANGLYMLTGPITTAFFPRFTELATNNDQVALRALYHQGAQLVTVLMGSAAMVMIVLGDRILRLWTGNPALTRHVAPLLAILALGAMLNGMMWIPYQMMLAHGWTTLTIKVNAVAVGVVVPAILWVVPRYGAIGAAWIWVSLNAFYVLITISLMHRKLLTAEKWRWYREDVAIPLTAATSAAFLCRWAMPQHLGRLGEVTVILITVSCILTAAALAAPLVRSQIVRHMPSKIRFFIPRTA